MERGYVRSYRKKIFSDLWRNKNAFRVFEFLLHSATYRPHKYFTGGTCIDLQPGDYVSSVRTIADRCFISVRESRSSIDYLKSTQRIAQRTTRLYSIFSIINWDIYQNPDKSNDTAIDTPSDTLTTQQRHSSDTAATQEQERKELKEGKEEDQRPSSPSGDPPPNGFSPDDMARLWNEGIEFFEKDRKVLIPKILKVTDERRKKAVSRIKDCQVDEARWRSVINAVHQSAFLSGEKPSKGHEGWAADFDFVVRSQTALTKILEGGYR